MSYENPDVGGVSLRDMDEWFINQGNGDVLLADPFIPDPEMARFPAGRLSPNGFPPILARHPYYSQGVDFLKTVNEKHPEFSIGILLTRSEVVSDLGPLDDIRDMVEGSLFTGVATTTGILATHEGRARTPFGAKYQDEYADFFNTLQKEVPNKVLPLNGVPRNGGLHADPADQAIDAMRQLIHMEPGGVEGNPGIAAMADLAHLNIESARTVLDFFAKAATIARVQRLKGMATLIVPFDTGLDTGRKTVNGGMDINNVEMEFAVPSHGYENEERRILKEDLEANKWAFENGAMPAHWFS